MRPDPKPILAGLALVMAFGTQASAETVRTEYRYPDRPDLAYVGGGKAYTLSDASPMAFSTFEAAISKEDAKRLLDQNGYESQLPKRMPAPYRSWNYGSRSTATIAQHIQLHRYVSTVVVSQV